MAVTSKQTKTVTLRRCKNYSLKAWVKQTVDKDSKKMTFFNYEIQRSTYKGKDSEGKSIWENQSLNLSKVDDIAYIDNLLNGLKIKMNTDPIKSFTYLANKTEDLKNYEIYRKYKDKDGVLKETKKATFPMYELLVLSNFLKDCNMSIDYIYRTFEPSERGINNQQDYSSSEDSFVEEKIDDDIPF